MAVPQYRAKVIRFNILHNIMYIALGFNFASVHRIYNCIEYILLTSSEKNNEHQDKWGEAKLKRRMDLGSMYIPRWSSVHVFPLELPETWKLYYTASEGTKRQVS
jgi:hypothetical protein